MCAHLHTLKVLIERLTDDAKAVTTVDVSFWSAVVTIIEIVVPVAPFCDYQPRRSCGKLSMSRCSEQARGYNVWHMRSLKH